MSKKVYFAAKQKFHGELILKTQSVSTVCSSKFLQNERKNQQKLYFGHLQWKTNAMYVARQTLNWLDKFSLELSRDDEEAKEGDDDQEEIKVD